MGEIFIFSNRMNPCLSLTLLASIVLSASIDLRAADRISVTREEYLTEGRNLQASYKLRY